MKHIRLEIRGMSCASCVGGVERALNELEGVSESSVNLATEQAEINYDAEKVSVAEIIQSVEDAGYEASEPQGVSSGSTAEYRLDIGGMTCATCVSGVEKAISRVEGTTDVLVNLATEEARFKWDGSEVERIIQAIEDAGFEAKVAEGSEPAGADVLSADSGFKRRFLLALPLAFVVSVMDMGPMLISAWHHAIHPYIFEWNLAQLLLTGFIMFYAGRSFFTGAWKAMKRKTADMNSLVAVGTGAAFLFSAYATFFGREGGLVTPMDVYFDTAAVIIALILLGKWMEERARHKSRDALSGLIKLTPQQAHLVDENEGIKTIPLDRVKTGDVLLVKAFEQVPVDGIIEDGSPSLDEAMMTGESVPADKQKGDPVTGGTRNTDQSFRMKATAVGEETALARLIETVRRAQGSKPPIQRLVDKIAAVFVPVVIVIALITLTVWMLVDGDPAKAIVNMVAVLIIACPCALGLATPTGIMVGSGRAAEKGILIKDAVTLEEAKKADVMLLDKTGTLTKGKMAVSGFIATDGFSDDELITLAASLEQESDHPLAKAITGEASRLGLKLSQPAEVKTLPGSGIEGIAEGRRIVIGALRDEDKSNKQFAAFADEHQQKGETVVSVRSDDALLGLIAVGDQLRDDATGFIKNLKKLGIHPVMVTGDQEKPARYIAAQLGIDDVRFEVKPDEKAEIVRLYQEKGNRVAMVGDGINDAAALVQADLGIALSSGTDLAVSSSDITIMGDSLDKVLEAVTLSRGVLRIIRQNLFWAFVYNTVGIPLAAFGILSPMFAALAMALSSVSVVSNSLRIKRL